jgi:hypothetical protein
MAEGKLWCRLGLIDLPTNDTSDIRQGQLNAYQVVLSAIESLYLGSQPSSILEKKLTQSSSSLSVRSNIS